MNAFFTTVFGTVELGIVDEVLTEWRNERLLDLHDPDVELAAAILIHLFREGNRTTPSLRDAASRHKWLSEHTFRDIPFPWRIYGQVDHLR